MSYISEAVPSVFNKSGSFQLILGRAEYSQLGNGSGSFIRVPLNISGRFMLKLRMVAAVGNNTYNVNTNGVPIFYIISPQFSSMVDGTNFIGTINPSSIFLGNVFNMPEMDYVIGPVSIPGYIDINVAMGSAANPLIPSSQNMCTANDYFTGALGIGTTFKVTILFDYEILKS